MCVGTTTLQYSPTLIIGTGVNDACNILQWHVRKKEIQVRYNWKKNVLSSPRKKGRTSKQCCQIAQDLADLPLTHTGIVVLGTYIRICRLATHTHKKSPVGKEGERLRGQKVLFFSGKVTAAKKSNNNNKTWLGGTCPLTSRWFSVCSKQRRKEKLWHTDTRAWNSSGQWLCGDIFFLHFSKLLQKGEIWAP